MADLSYTRRNMLISLPPPGYPGFPYLESDRVLEFTERAPFQALMSAEDWLTDHGFSIGPCQRGDPRGIKLGSILIAKWRGLTEQDRERLDGILVGPHGGMTLIRGPIIVRLRAE